MSVNFEIALRHILSRKKQTLIAALGVTIGIGMYIFTNSMMGGFGVYSRNEMFKVNPHIRIYREDEISQPIASGRNDEKLSRVIINPSIVSGSKTIANPQQLIERIKGIDFVVNVAPQVNTDVFYNKGDSQCKGMASGINIAEADAMFNISSTMLAGSLYDLQGNLNGIVLGSGVAEKLSLNLNDNITISSSRGVLKVMKVVGIFSAGNKNTDESKSYLNIATAQQLFKESSTFISDIYVKTNDLDKAVEQAAALQLLTPYQIEPWQVTNADMLAGDKIRDIMGTSVTLTILLVAAFGIYNIMNMTISQKLNDIAILKATGFNGLDIVRIFLAESIIMGLLGTLIGLAIGFVCIKIMSGVYVGGPSGHFPIYFNATVFVTGGTIGMLVTSLAGYLPARKAANVDPVAIFRK
jgi:lipoprotein-releasing system permease protein